MTKMIDAHQAARRATTIAFRVENEGYCLARELVAPELVAAIDADLDTEFARTPFCVGDFYGERTKRFGRLLIRSPGIARLVMHAGILDLVDRVLGPWCDTIQLNVAQAIEIHPGALAQCPHRDEDMWRGGGAAAEYLLNIIWPLSPFTQANGATRVWPGSHGRNAGARMTQELPVTAVADPGDALIFLGSTLHAAGANLSRMPRRAIVIGYSLGWLRTHENQFLAYPPEVARHFPPELAGLVGYRQHRPNLGNIDGRCPSHLLDDDSQKPVGAVDALLPDQVRALAAHASEERSVRAGAQGRSRR